MVALVIEGADPSLLFTQRAAGLSRHGGEVSFPGGLCDPEDDSLQATALREVHEEIGIDPSIPHVLGALPAVHTFVSGILVTPFVATLESLPALRVSAAEIGRVLTVPIRELASIETRRELSRDGGPTWTGWWYRSEGATVWGATGAMVHALLDLVRKEASWLLE